MSNVVGVGQISLMDLNDAIIAGIPPSNPTVGTLWIDESQDPPMLKKWNGEAWIDLGELDPNLSVVIEEINETLGNMANDNLINFQERQVIKDKLTEIIGYVIADTATTLPTVSTLDNSGKGSFWSVRKSARNVGISTSDTTYVNVATKYNNLKSYLEGLTPIVPWDTRNANADVVVPVTKSTFRDMWLQYYLAVDALAELTAQKIKENNDELKDDVDVIGRDLDSLTGRVTTVESKVTDESIVNAVMRTEKWVEQINTINKSIDTAEENSLTHLRFNGESSYVDFGSVFNDNYTNFSFQLDLRYKGQGSKTATFGYVVHKNNSSAEGDAPFVIYVKGKDIIVQVQKTANNYRYITLTDGYNDDIFYNIAVTFSNGTLRAYVDGELKGEVTGLTFTNNTGSLAIGGDAYGGGSYNRYFDGVVKNVSVWDKALTKEEIVSNMEYIEEGASNLIHYWKLNEGMGNIAVDNVSNMNGIIYGATWHGSATNAIDILAERINSVEQNITADGIFTEIVQTESWENIMSQFAQSDSLGDFATKDELGELSEDVDSRIDNAIQGIDFEPYATKLELEQTSREITAKFSATGGLNLIKNSIGFAGVDFWDGTENLIKREMVDITTSSISAEFDNRNKLKMSGRASKEYDGANIYIQLEVGKTYTLSYKIRKTGGTLSNIGGHVEAEYQTRVHYMVDGVVYNNAYMSPPTISSLNDGDWHTVAYTFKATSGIDSNSRISVQPNIGMTTVVDFEIIDIVLQEGESYSSFPTTISNTELDTLGFGSGFQFENDGELKDITQEIPVVAGAIYTMSWYVNKRSSFSNNGRLIIEAIDSDGVTNLHTYESNVITDGYEYRYANITPSSNTLLIRIKGEGNLNATVTGMMMTIGDVPLQWSLATGEVYNTNIKMDINGIRVSQLDKDRQEIGYTQITPDEFAGYYDSDGNGTFEKVFYLNGEETVTKKFRALNEITMGGIKVVNINSGGRNGWAFVPIVEE